MSLRDFEIKATGLYNSSEHFINNTLLVASFEVFASTLNSLSKSGAANTGFVVKILLSSSNAFYCSCPHCHFTSFLVNMFIGLAT